MAAYIIAIRNSTSDPAELALYGEGARAARTPNLKGLARYGKFEVLEGAPSEGVVLLEFPTYDEAKAWYDSPAYQAAKQHRLKGADYRFILFEGVD